MSNLVKRVACCRGCLSSNAQNRFYNNITRIRSTIQARPSRQGRRSDHDSRDDFVLFRSTIEISILAAGQNWDIGMFVSAGARDTEQLFNLTRQALCEASKKPKVRATCAKIAASFEGTEFLPVELLDAINMYGSMFRLISIFSFPF